MIAINQISWVSPGSSGKLGIGLVLLVLLTASVDKGEAQQQRGFASPQQALTALVAAIDKNDEAELLAVFGPGSEELISSGDPVADQRGRTRFLRAYAERERTVPVGEDRAQCLIGDKEYPFPIPLVKQGEHWFFDTLAGKEEILNRRIGRNELHTIDVLQAYVDAQHEYAGRNPRNGEPEFAQRFASNVGIKDGLYWPVTEGEQESPFGPLIARATAEGYGGDLDQEPPEPFHGYYFKILTAQGEHADGGAFDYVVQGKMVLGFALVAFPASYGNSGIMTFIVNQQGVIYEQDFGPETAEVGAAMIIFDPDASWRKYQESVER